MKPLIIFIMLVFLAGCSKKVVPQGEGMQASTTGVVAEGKVIFMNKCNRCHPSGMAGLGPSIFNKPLPGFMIRLQVRRGFGAMPSFDKNQIPDQDLKKLITYIKSN